MLTDCTLLRVQSVYLLRNHISHHTFTFSLYIIIAVFFSSCCAKLQMTDKGTIYTASSTLPQISATHQPGFYVKFPAQPYDRIGTPIVIEKSGGPFVQVDSTYPTMYFEQEKFTTKKSTYTNLIYRIHFSKVPFGLCNLNITAGNNPGLLIIYTLNHTNKLILITTVHTCGCYLAFFPTTDLQKPAYPNDWSFAPQSIYGYTLPGILPAHASPPDQPYYITLESGSHRISDISNSITKTPDQITIQQMKIRPMEDLYYLPYKDKTISFFEDVGRREGYVKNSSKILERLLISWWAFDWHVGEDKAYGKDDTSKTPFYTSLKFWQRNSSDMKNFSQFLSYWGWKL